MKPDYEEKGIKAYLGDCLEVMPYIEDNSVDLTVTSPPYDNLRTYENDLVWNWDVFTVIANQLYRVTKEGGVVVWVVGDATTKGSETGTSFKQALYFKDVCGFNLHDTMIYSKASVPKNHNRYEQDFEYMFIFSKGKPNCFNSIRIPTLWPEKDGSRDGQFFKVHDEKNRAMRSGKNRKPVGNEKIKGNIWRYSVGGGQSTKDKIAFSHPAIFPEQLAYDHIISWSNEGDTVLDPMMGSGTTGKMAKILKRNFIGIEKVPKYFGISTERIQGTKVQGVLNL